MGWLAWFWHRFKNCKLVNYSVLHDSRLMPAIRRGVLSRKELELNPNRTSSWERLVFWLVAAVVGSELLADVLPRLVVPVVVLIVLLLIARIVWFHTRRW